MKKVFVRRQTILHQDGHQQVFRGGEHWVEDGIADKLLESGNAELMEQAESSTNKSMTAADKKRFMAGSWPGKRPSVKAQDAAVEAPAVDQAPEPKAEKPKAAKKAAKTVSRETESQPEEAK